MQQNPLAYVGSYYTFTPHSGALANANYSPMSYTPHTRSYLSSASEDAAHYYDLITSALKWITHHEVAANKYHSSLNGGVFRVCQGVYCVATVPGVTTALQLSNIYHSLKAMQGDLANWAHWLNSEGVPTLVQSIHTGHTPPFDSDGAADGMEPL